MNILIENQMIDLNDPRLKFRLESADEKSARITAVLEVEVMSNMKITVGNHSHAMVNSVTGRQELANYPEQVQHWLIPAIWGDKPTVEETEPTHPQVGE